MAREDDEAAMRAAHAVARNREDAKRASEELAKAKQQIRVLADGRFKPSAEDLHAQLQVQLVNIDQDHTDRGLYSSSIRLLVRHRAHTAHLRTLLAARVQTMIEAHGTAGLPLDDAARGHLSEELHRVWWDEKQRMLRDAQDTEGSAGFSSGNMRVDFARAVHRDAGHELRRACDFMGAECAQLDLRLRATKLTEVHAEPPPFHLPTHLNLPANIGSDTASDSARDNGAPKSSTAGPHGKSDPRAKKGARGRPPADAALDKRVEALMEAGRLRGKKQIARELGEDESTVAASMARSRARKAAARRTGSGQSNNP